MNFPCSNIPAAPVYGVYLSQLMHYFRACGSYHECLDIGLLLTKKLLYIGFLFAKLKSSFRRFYDHHNVLVNHYGTSMSYMNTFRSFSHLCYITGFVNRIARRVPLVEHMSSPIVFDSVRVTRSFALCVKFCRSLFVILSFS